jgi:hypothetical protein
MTTPLTAEPTLTDPLRRETTQEFPIRNPIPLLAIGIFEGQIFVGFTEMRAAKKLLRPHHSSEKNKNNKEHAVLRAQEHFLHVQTQAMAELRRTVELLIEKKE